MTSSGSGVRRRLRTLRNRALRGVAPIVGRLVAGLPRGGAIERFLLARTWGALPADMLDAYLVSGYQNPRINVQSILLRHFLLRRLFGDEFEQLMDEELRFAIELNEVLRTRAAELGVRIGSYVDPEKFAGVQRVDEEIRDREREMVDRWRATLEGRSAGPISVLELACGSANDYRAFVECGLADFLVYRGIDLTSKNVENARRRFPGVRFEVGDVRNVFGADASVDYVIASDIFEHLSIEGMEAALGEAMRLARRGLALTFFSMADVAEHEVRPERIYFRNVLSRARIEERLRSAFARVEVVPIARWLADRYGYRHTYNTHAFSIFAQRDAAP